MGKEAEQIIRKAGKMKDMLASVYEFNTGFLLNNEKEKLLEKILFAMTAIDRGFFYGGDEMYSDVALSIGHGQTISQPSTVARMLMLADLQEGDEVLEVGSGSGWNAALASFLVYPGKIVSIELLNKLKEQSEKNISGLRNYLKQKKPELYSKIEKINFYAESIFAKEKAWKQRYDKIIITAGIKKGEEKRIEYLASRLLRKEGILICPYLSGPMMIFKNDGKLKRFLTKENYVFVPLLE